MKYAVVVTYSFNGEMPVYLFDDYDKAKQYLHDMWQYCCNVELAESFVPIDELETYHEDDYAQIRWTDDGVQRFTLTATSEPMRINGKSYK